jgi:hypothetical protein
MVTSEAYKRSSALDAAAAAANLQIDPANDRLWAFPLKRLEAEPVWDSILSSAGTLDTTVGGPSFDIAAAPVRPGGGGERAADRAPEPPPTRRGAYMIRGFATSREVVPNFLQAFDVEDGRLPCPLRTRTVTAPQSLFLMNGEEIERATAQLSERVQKQAPGDLRAAVDLAYRITLGRPPSPRERDESLTYVGTDPARLKGLGWLLFNLDEFIFVR